jgi:hypothetical protein
MHALDDRRPIDLVVSLRALLLMASVVAAPWAFGAGAQPGALAGVLGAIVGVPLAATIQVVGQGLAVARRAEAAAADEAAVASS